MFLQQSDTDSIAFASIATQLTLSSVNDAGISTSKIISLQSLISRLVL